MFQFLKVVRPRTQKLVDLHSNSELPCIIYACIIVRYTRMYMYKVVRSNGMRVESFKINLY